MKIATFILVITVAFLPFSPTSFGQNADPELEKARELFPEFQNLLERDPRKAKAPFDQFLKLKDPVKLRLQNWLDAKWIEKRREYEMTETDSSSSNKQDSAALREHREILEEIRLMNVDSKMKERLKKEGWNALQTLLTIKKKNHRVSKESPKQNTARDRALKELIAIGNYRYAIRVHRGQQAIKPREELGLTTGKAGSNTVPDSQSIEASRADRSVLEQNERMKSEVPPGEYQGILELNQWRIAMGLNALVIDPKLCEAARDHSKDMKTHGFFAHESPLEGKKTPWDRAANFGTKARAENIAINGSPAGANKSWFHSPGHHKNMFASGRTYVGLGQAGRHFTQLFR